MYQKKYDKISDKYHINFDKKSLFAKFECVT